MISDETYKLTIAVLAALLILQTIRAFCYGYWYRQLAATAFAHMADPFGGEDGYSNADRFAYEVADGLGVNENTVRAVMPKGKPLQLIPFDRDQFERIDRGYSGRD